MPPAGMAIVAPKEEVESEGDVVTVLVTGFGPFLDQFPINSSWSIASTLPALLPGSKSHPTTIRIIVHPFAIRVAYARVLSLAPTLATSVSPKPDIILHIGLAAGRDYFTMERGAHRDGYGKHTDVDGHKFSNEASRAHWPDHPSVLHTGLKFEDVWKRWRASLDQSIDVRPSKDAGNFLCGFIYYTSMATFWGQQKEGQGEGRGVPVMFLHVPDLPKEEDIAQGREVAIALIRACVESWKKDGAGDVVKEKMQINGAIDEAPEDENPHP